MDLTDLDTAAAWLGVQSDDPFLERLIAVASTAITTYLDREEDFDPDEIPPPVEQACLETVAYMYRNRKANPAVSAMTVGDASVTFRDASLTKDDPGLAGPIPASARSLLAPYRRIYLTSTA